MGAVCIVTTITMHINNKKWHSIQINDIKKNDMLFICYICRINWRTMKNEVNEKMMYVTRKLPQLTRSKQKAHSKCVWSGKRIWQYFVEKLNIFKYAFWFERVSWYFRNWNDVIQYSVNNVIIKTLLWYMFLQYFGCFEQIFIEFWLFIVTILSRSFNSFSFLISSLIP